MFIQIIIQITIVAFFAWLGWKFVVAPILKSKGIQVEDEKEIITNHSKRLQQLRDELVEKQVSKDAAEESVVIMNEIHKLESLIKMSNNTIKDLESKS